MAALSLALIAALVAAEPFQGFGDGPKEIDELESFVGFMRKYDKHYQSGLEMSERYAVFKENLALIHAHNSRNDTSYSLKMNEFADMNWEDFQNTRLGVSQNCSATHPRKKLRGGTTYVVPDAIDWRKKGVVTPVKNQGGCGSCWTFSTTGCLESHHALKTGKLVSLSEQNLIDCAGAFNNKGCGGGLPSQAFEYVRYNGGLDTEASYPYIGKNEACTFSKKGIGATVSSQVNITYQDEDELHQSVGAVGPVSIAFQVASDFRFYHKGVYDSKVCKSGPKDVNHAVLAVGYDTDKDSGKDYWIVKNSWGPTWGDKGYFHIKRGDNMCGLADCASYPIV